MRDHLVLKYVDPGSGYTLSAAGGWLAAFLLALFGLAGSFTKRIFRPFKKLSILILALLCLSAALYLLLKGVFMEKKIPFEKKIIILGMDALSPEVMERMMSQGLLPNFSRLKNQGSYARLATANPAQSPVAWAVFATGKNPAENGVFDFIIRDPEDYRLSLALSDFKNEAPQPVLKSKAFWRFLSQVRVPVVVLNCPLTFPPDKVEGKMLSGMGVPDILGTEGTFTFYTSEALSKEKDTGGKVFHIDKKQQMRMELIGPRVKSKSGDAHLSVAFTAAVENRAARIRYQGRELVLSPGQWSDWCQVVFSQGLFGKKIKGIFKFYLVGLEPEFALYISPINFDPRQPLFPISYPSGYARELAGAVGLFHTQGMPLDTWSVNEGRMTEDAFFKEFKSTARESVDRFSFELRRFQRGVFFAYFGSVDTLQHMHWRQSDQGSLFYDPQQAGPSRQKIEEQYQEMDRIAGMAMEHLREGDTLLILSDHGFTSFDRAAHLNSWLRQAGYLVLKGQAKAGRELLADVDWSRTKAYAIGFGSIYLNQKHREGQGIVEPGKESEDLKARIASALLSWQDPVTNKRLVKQVYRKEEIFFGAHADLAPDLVVGFEKGYRASWQTALGAAPEPLIEDNRKKWGGDHLVDPSLVPGVLLSNKKITAAEPSLYSFVPTMLKLAGFTDEEIKKEGFTGQALF